MKIGIIGGSFNPIHLGHLIIAESVRVINKLDKILFIPTGKAPHKNYETSSEDRINMVNLAIEDNDCFMIEDYEVNKDSLSYTIETLEFLSNKYPEAKLYFIIGLDNLHNLKDWKGIEDYNKYTEIILTERKAKVPSDTFLTINKYKEIYNLDIHYMKTPIIEISSTEIRKKVSNSESIKYLTTDEVIDYIQKRGLYK